MLIVINEVHLNETFRMVRFGMSLCAICKNAMPDVHNSVYLGFFLHEHVQPSTYEVKLAVYVSMFFSHECCCGCCVSDSVLFRCVLVL